MKIHTADIGTRLRNAAGCSPFAGPCRAGCFGAVCHRGRHRRPDDRRPPQNSETYRRRRGPGDARSFTRINEKARRQGAHQCHQLQPQGAAHRRGAQRTGIKAEHGETRRCRHRPTSRAITNELAGRRPVELPGARSNDTYITSKVKARFIDAGKFSGQPRQGGDRGRRRVPARPGHAQAEADEAVEIARTTGGVQESSTSFRVPSRSGTGQARWITSPAEERQRRSRPTAKV
jgi:hypothetical protein